MRFHDKASTSKDNFPKSLSLKLEYVILDSIPKW